MPKKNVAEKIEVLRTFTVLKAAFESVGHYFYPHLMTGVNEEHRSFAVDTHFSLYGYYQRRNECIQRGRAAFKALITGIGLQPRIKWRIDQVTQLAWNCNADAALLIKYYCLAPDGLLTKELIRDCWESLKKTRNG